MHKISNVQQLCYLREIPEEVIQIITEAITILDTEYDSNRDENDGYGGFVLILQSESDLPSLERQLTKIHIDIENILPEYVETVICTDGQTFTNALVLCGSDFGVVIISPIAITPESLKKYLVN